MNVKVIQIKASIGEDQTLHLDLPCDLPPGPVTVTVLVEPGPSPGAAPYDTLGGLLRGKFPPNVDVEAEVREMAQEWEKSLEPTP